MSNHDREGPQSRDQDAARDAAQDATQVTALKRAWQQASDEQPPLELDAAIVAAARKAVQDRDQATKTVPASARPRNRWMQWQPLAAAATVAGLAFILVQLLPRDRDVAPSIRMEESTPGPATAEEKQSATAPAVAAPQAAAETTLGTAAFTPSAPEATAKATVGATVETTAKASEMDATATADGAVALDAAEAGERKAVVPEMAGRAASAAAPAPALERSLGNAAPPGAADRAAGIAALYAAGDVTGAADALRAFRAADPDADTYLPDSLRGWARTVK
jgi:hypothetical protein